MERGDGGGVDTGVSDRAGAGSCGSVVVGMGVSGISLRVSFASRVLRSIFQSTNALTGDSRKCLAW